MPKTVRRTTFATDVYELEHLRKPLPPDVGHPIEALAAASHERLLPELLDPRLKSIAQPVGNPHKNVPAILLRAQEHFVAVQSVDVEQHDVGNPQARMRH